MVPDTFSTPLLRPCPPRNLRVGLSYKFRKRPPVQVSLRWQSKNLVEKINGLGQVFILDVLDHSLEALE